MGLGCRRQSGEDERGREFLCVTKSEGGWEGG